MSVNKFKSKLHKALQLSVIICTALIFLLSGAANVRAADNAQIDTDKIGSISLTLEENGNGNVVSGVHLSLYRVAEITQLNGSFAYSYLAPYSGCGFDIGNINTNGFTEDISKTAVNHFEGHIDNNDISAAQTLTTDSTGTVKFVNLKTGLYMIRQTNSVDGYYNISSFLVTIPMKNETDGAWIYDVNASPKVEIIPKDSEPVSVSVHKTWNSNGAAVPSSVSVSLLRNGNIEETVQLNDGNSWSYTWDGLDGTDIWSVSEIDVPDGYTVSYSTDDNKTEIVNEHKSENPPTTPDTPPQDENPSVAGAIRKILGVSKPKGEVLGTKRLIQTGQLNWPVPVLAVSGIIFIAMGGVIVFKKRKN